MSEKPFNVETDLQSLIDDGMADDEFLVKALMDEYYLEMCQLAQAMLDDPSNAHRATIQSISIAYSDLRRGGRHAGDRVWSFEQCIKTINRQAKAKPKSDITKESIESSDLGLEPDRGEGGRRIFKSYGRKEQYAIALYYLLGWDTGDIATLLKVNKNAINLQLDLARERFQSEMNEDISSATIPKTRQVERHLHLDTYISSIFKQIWPKPRLNQDEWNNILEQILNDDVREKLLFGMPGMWGRVILIFAGLILISIIVMISSLLMSDFQLPRFANNFLEEVTPIPTIVLEFPLESEAQTYQYIVQPGDSLESISLHLNFPIEQLLTWNNITPDSALFPGQAINVVPYAVNFPAQAEHNDEVEVEAIRSNAGSETILQRLNSSHTLWDTLWIDTQSIDYGPAGYIGAPRFYHSQAWIDQPEYSLELFGPLGEEPSSVSLVMDRSHYMFYPEIQIPRITVWDDHNQFDVQSEPLRWMIYPQTAPWVRHDGHFEVIETGEIAGRRTITVDWYDIAGNRQVRLWLDRNTGMSLRLQEYGGPDFETILSDTMTTAIIYNIEVPQASLFDPHALLIQDYATLPADADLSDQPAQAALVIPQNNRLRLPVYPAPPDLNPATSQLHFQFSERETPSDSQGNPILDTTELYADGYTLGEALIFPPWGLQCVRSPDGQHLVYNSQSDGVSASDLSLRWIKLTDPEFVYEPLQGFQAESFAFAPDSRRLAVFGTNLSDAKRSIQIVDLGNSDSWQLLEIYNANSLVWSPDGGYVAFIGQRSDTPEYNIMVVNIDLGEIIFESIVQLTEGPQKFIWPDLNWELEFPIPIGDMGACAEPPVQ